jgi:hypothetical protein
VRRTAVPCDWLRSSKGCPVLGSNLSEPITSLRLVAVKDLGDQGIISKSVPKFQLSLGARQRGDYVGLPRCVGSDSRPCLFKVKLHAEPTEPTSMLEGEALVCSHTPVTAFDRTCGTVMSISFPNFDWLQAAIYTGLLVISPYDASSYDGSPEAEVNKLYKAGSKLVRA